MGEAGLMNTVFQSSSSVRKATPHISPLIRHTQSFQSPPSVRKATSGNIATWPSYYISIPAFREEGDAPQGPPPPHRNSISIPAFREEGDLPVSVK